MTDLVTQAGAGWYPDPDMPGMQRYWNGESWTHYRQPYPPLNHTVQQVTVNEPRKRVNHLLHLVLTILTAGLWLPVWIIIALANS